MVKYLVPDDTGKFIGSNLKRCMHAGLMLTRYASQEAINRDNVPDDRNGTKIRDVWLKQIAQQITATGDLKKLIDASVERWLAMTEGASQFALITRSRLIVGLGAKGALKMGITLHHTTGLPYIPGSALKGLARSDALLTLAAEKNIQLEELEQFDAELIRGKHDDLPGAKSYREIFGWADDSKRDIKGAAAGQIVFHDAILYEVPSNVKQIFTLDVMTPHFTEYYRSDGKKAPHDGDSPNPVTFLTVNAGLTFTFAVSARKGVSDEVRKQARAWLRKGLIEMGIGSKTAAGYGIFEPQPKQ